MTFTRPRLVRWLVPLIALLVLFAVAGLRATLADAAPSLAKLSAAQLLAKVANADVKSFSGVVRTRADLGLPALPGGGKGSLDPQELLAGDHTLRVFFDGPQRQRVDLLGDLAETKVVHNGRDIWQWSSATNKATHTRLPAPPADRPGAKPGQAPKNTMPEATPQALAQTLVKAIGPTTQISVGTAATVAGRSAYDLRIAPKTADSLIERADLYVDSSTGLPLRVTVHTRSGGKPAIDIGFTKFFTATPAASVFTFRAPAGAKVTERSVPGIKRPSGAKSHPAPLWLGDTGPDKAQPRDAVPGLALRGKALQDRLANGAAPTVLGSGWASVVEIRGLPGGAISDPRIGGFLKGARSETGRFGSGNVITTRLLTVLITDDGRIFAGAVTVPAMLRLANAAGPR
ncbi:MAG: hypothetical protein WCB04_05765 [Mycobacteriales bacterium]